MGGARQPKIVDTGAEPLEPRVRVVDAYETPTRGGHPQKTNAELLIVGPGERGHLLPLMLDRVRVGIPKVEAIRSLGVSLATVYEWEKERPDVKLAFEQAEAAAMGVYLSYVANAAQKGIWQAAAWMLERRWPDRFGRTAVEVTGAGGGPVELEVTLKLDRSAGTHRADDEEA